ncbi:MAG: LicD family protein, partial [Anaerovibrio sp.]
MYCDIKAVCDKYNLTIVLGGGSALGAVRHKGFIPWDDDLDLNMPRKDYEKLLSVLEAELGKEYYFSAPHTKGVESQFLKIHKKDTTFS